MNAGRWALAVAIVVGGYGSVRGESTQDVPLRSLTAVGTIVVTAADGTVPEDILRAAVETRFAKAGIAIDSSSPADFLVNVSADRNRSEDGRCAFENYIVSIQLRELVSVEREPAETFHAVTWQTRGSVSHFGSSVPKQAIQDLLQGAISTFLRARGIDRQADTAQGSR